MDPPPPPPPPHGANPPNGKSGGLPDGKYDIFVIPPHSAGAGFLYLPSLHTNRNSFLAGVACTAAAFFIWSIVVPAIKDWFNGIFAGGGSGLLLLVLSVGVACWAWGKTQAERVSGSGKESTAGTGGASGGTFGSQSTGYPQPNGTRTSWQRPNPQPTGAAGTGTGTGAKSSWEKAREETRKKEEERRRTEEVKKRREELEKERQKQREKETRERGERERKEKREKEAAAAKARTPSPKKPPHPSAATENEDDAYSFRPYDRPKKPVHKANSAASLYSEESCAASQTTARTTPPPPQNRGPYTTKDPDKIIVKGVYAFNNAFQRTPIAQLLSGKGNVTDGLILRITTEGLFIDDDIRGVPQREWDVKAWTMKLAESAEIMGLHVLRASIRDQEGKKYVFILSQTEGWKVAVGLQKLRRGTQVRSLGVSGLPANEAKVIIESLGWA